MKYKIITDDIVKNLIEFLDDVQFDAAGSKDPKDLSIINYCSYMINELLTSPDVYEDNPETSDNIESLIDEFDNMDDDRFEKTMQYFNNFFERWDKKYGNKKKKKKLDKKKSNKSKRLSLEEEFEQYYIERKNKKEKRGSVTFDKLLKNTGLRKSSGGSDTR